jgi:hypothetical protein
LVPYVKASGSCPVMDFLEDLRSSDLRTFLWFNEVLRPLIEERGPFEIGGSYWEALGDGLYEISFGRRRIYCSVEGRRVIMMYQAVRKTWQKFRKSDRKLCEQARAEVQSGEYDEEKRAYLYKLYIQRRTRNGTA